MLDEQRASGVERIYLAGEFDIASEPELERMLTQSSHHDIVEIDFKRVTYIDSSAITALVRLKKRMIENGYAGIVKIRNLNSKIRRIFEICALEQLFEIEPAD